MVENTELPLNRCSDIITTVSITGGSRISTHGQQPSKSFVRSYSERSDQDEHLSFSEFVYQDLRRKHEGFVVAHFVGMNNFPCIPVSASYARSTLILHIPWRNFYFHQLNNSSCIEKFFQVIKTNGFPKSVNMAYVRAQTEYDKKILMSQQIQTNANCDDDCTTDNDDDPAVLNDEDDLLLRCVTTLQNNGSLTDNDHESIHFDQGLEYDWGQRVTVSLM